MGETARLEVDGKSYELPIVTGSEGERAVDIRNLRSETGLITLDPGYKNSGSWVFQNKLKPGERWRETGNAYYGIHRAFKRAGLYRKGKLTHEIRRAVASTMLQNVTPIHVVKEILGHSAIKTTELYAFTNEKAKREASKNALV